MSDDAPQLVDEISTLKKMDEWVLEIGARLDNPNISHPTSTDEEWQSIFGNWKCLDDFGASFLPETIQWKFVAYMTRWFGLNVRSYLKDFQEKEDDVWRYYRGVDEQFRAENSKRFIEYLLANSCFLIFVMVSLQNNSQQLEEIFGETDFCDPKDQSQRYIEYENLSAFIFRNQMGTQRHLLTMDYQIPWFVVDAVYTKHSNLKSELLNTPIHELALSYLEDIYPQSHKSKVHHDTITPPPHPPRGFQHLLHIFHWSRSPKEKFAGWMACKKMESFSIPSATDLQLSGTIFKKHPDGSIDVDYSIRRLSGVMQLAPWHLYSYSIKIYESLLRFELEYGCFCGRPFTAYVACMMCLLQTEADVRLLRANDIIATTRNDENDVLRYVQEFKTLLDDNVSMSKDLKNLTEEVWKHHEKKPARYYGEFKNRYCSNPWITISVIAGILLFVLTFIQTLYGTLSYYKQ